MITVSSKQIVLFRTFVSITNVFDILDPTHIIKMVYLNGQSKRSLKWPMPWWSTCLFSGKMALVQTCGQWLLVIPHILIITCPMLRKLHLLIFSLELNLPVTSLNIFTCGVALYTYWIPLFNKAVNSQNVSHDLFAGSLLDSVQIFQVMLLWYSTQILATYTHNFMLFLMINSAQSSIFLPRKNLLLSGINLISMVLYTQWILMIMLMLL